MEMHRLKMHMEEMCMVTESKNSSSAALQLPVLLELLMLTYVLGFFFCKNGNNYNIDCQEAKYQI